jgi:adenylate cyclase
MDSLCLSIISSRELEYIIIDQNFKTLELSPKIDRFSEFPQDIQIDNDIRLAFPELCGVEEAIKSISQGSCPNFKIQRIAKTNPRSNLEFYTDLYIGCIFANTELERRIIILLEDTTEQTIVQQKLFQQVNESILLKTAWSESQAYLDKIINSITDSLLVTNWQGIIKKTNPAVQKMFGYTEKELIDQSLDVLITEPEKLPKYQPGMNLKNGDLFWDLEAICTTKFGQDIVVTFSCFQLRTELANLSDFIYLGKNVTKNFNLH